MAAIAFLPPPLNSARRSYRPCLELLEGRVVLDNNYWTAAGATPIWNLDTNWNLGHVPFSTDIAIFDGTQTTTPCTIPSGVSVGPAGVTFAANLPANTSMLTVSGNLTVGGPLTLNARTAGGGREVNITTGGVISVQGIMTFAGGMIYGGGTLSLDAYTGFGGLHIAGTSSSDPPTLAVSLDLGGGSESYSETMDWTGAAVQPLVVTNGANITVENGSTIQFDNRPFAGNTTATAVSNGDNGSETIIVKDGGYVTSDGTAQRIVGMGLDVSEGNNAAVNSGFTTPPQLQELRFTGKNTDGFGLDLNGGSVTVQGAMTFDKGGYLSNGNIEVYSAGALSLGQASQMFGGVQFTLKGILAAHGGFDMSGGTLSTRSGQVGARINMDSGDVFALSGYGTIQLDATSVSGSLLTVNGTFWATGGFINDTVSPGNNQYGAIQVDGDVRCSTGCTFTAQAVAPGSGPDNSWQVLSWTGTRLGDGFSTSLPTNWIGSINDPNKVLTLSIMPSS